MKFKFLLILLLIPHVAFSYYVYRPCCSRLQACGWWGSADYLLLWRKQRFYPPLVTTNPTLPPVLSDPNTEILFGDKFIGASSPKSGGKGDFGIWICKCLGVGLGFYVVDHEKINFNLNDEGGVPIFGQPFFNVATGMQDVNLLSFPGLFVNGNIEIDTANRFWGFDIYTRARFFDWKCLKMNILFGFMYSSLTDNLGVNTRTSTALLETITVNDQFNCENTYCAGLLGLMAELRRRKWAFMGWGKIGLGNMRKEIEISGNTVLSTGGVVTNVFESGFLAQPSNIGDFSHTKFEVVSMAGANIQFPIGCHAWLTAGYTYMFWPFVALAGEQVNLNINRTQVPGPIVGTPAPEFREHLTSFWAHGLTAGIYFRY